MPKFLSPMIGAAVAALVMGSTGYCAFNPVNVEPPVTTLPQHPALRLLPEAIIPYPLQDLGEADGAL